MYDGRLRGPFHIEKKHSSISFFALFSGPKRDRLRKYLRCQLVHTLRNRRLKPSNSARRRSTGNFLCKFNSLPVFGCRWNRVPIRRRRLPQRASSLSIATTSTTTQKTFLARGLLWFQLFFGEIKKSFLCVCLEKVASLIEVSWGGTARILLTQC